MSLEATLASVFHETGRNPVIHIRGGAHTRAMAQRLAPARATYRDSIAPEVNLLIMEGAVNVDAFGHHIAEALRAHDTDRFVLTQLKLDATLPESREELSGFLAARHPEFVFRILVPPEQAGAEGALWVQARRRRRRAWLLLDASTHGKTTAARELAAASRLPVCHGDELLFRIAVGQVPATPRLVEATRRGHEAQNWSIAIQEVFSSDLYREFLDIVLARHAAGDFIFEMFVPIEHRRLVHQHLSTRSDIFAYQPGYDAALRAIEAEAEVRRIRRLILVRIPNLPRRLARSARFRISRLSQALHRWRAARAV